MEPNATFLCVEVVVSLGFKDFYGYHAFDGSGRRSCVAVCAVCVAASCTGHRRRRRQRRRRRRRRRGSSSLCRRQGFKLMVQQFELLFPGLQSRDFAVPDDRALLVVQVSRTMLRAEHQVVASPLVENSLPSGVPVLCVPFEGHELRKHVGCSACSALLFGFFFSFQVATVSLLKQHTYPISDNKDCCRGDSFVRFCEGDSFVRFCEARI
mmetsp:Transcript_18956/g.37375  ORF Transcript_18956/g.37375 Transcript_18956/m.37375 type:complete len:210 (+) Transcript_18956:413-1042(+)